MHVLVALLGICVLLLVLRSVLVAVGQGRYVYFPDRNVAITPARLGMAFEDLRLQSEDGETVHAWHVPAPERERDKENRLTILFCHGNAGDIGDRVDTIQTFHKLGFAVLIFDYRGYGESTGKTTEKGTYLDALAAWNHLVNTKGVPADGIVIFGRSLGGAVATWLAARRTPRALVVESTFSSAPDMAAKMFPFLPVKLFCSFHYDSVAAIRKVDCPAMVAHSRQDSMIPFTQGRRIFEAAREPKLFVELQGDHNAGGIDIDPSYQKLLFRFVTPKS